MSRAMPLLLRDQLTALIVLVRFRREASLIVLIPIPPDGELVAFPPVVAVNSIL